MAEEAYLVTVDDLPSETIEAVDDADLQVKLAAYLSGDGFAHVGDDVNVSVRSPDGRIQRSVVADHRGQGIY